MKTTKPNYAVKAITALLVGATLVSCGSDNKSGGKNSGNNGTTFSPSGHPGNFPTINGLSSQALQTIINENPCRTGNTHQFGGMPTTTHSQRSNATFPINNFNVDIDSVYVGATYDGDIAIISNKGGRAQMDLMICPRPDLNGQGYLVGTPVLNVSDYCPVSEITAADVRLGATSQFYGNYELNLKFAPIHVPNLKMSSLCTMY